MKTVFAVGLLGLVILTASFSPWPSVSPSFPAILGGVGGRASSAAVDKAYGQALFAAKGCAHCHTHPAIRGSGPYTFSGATMPNFASYQADPAYLRRWLSDPTAIKPTTQMPKLDLSDEEIDALIAFVNTH